MSAAVETLRWSVADGLAVTRRNLEHVRQVPEKLVDVTLQPLLFTLLFAYVFGGSVHVPGGDYRSWVVTGIFVQTLSFGMMGAALGMAGDLQNGLMDRFRVLPMSRGAVLVGRTLADLATTVVALAVMTAAGLVVGWRVHGNAGEVAAAYGLLLAFSFAMSWVGTLVGLVARSVDSVQGIVFVAIFPLTFVANTFVDPDRMPAVLRAVAQYNPISALTGAVRSLFGNATASAAGQPWPLAHPVPAALLWCVAIVAVAAPLAVRRYAGQGR